MTEINVLEVITNGGITAILFVIWYYTFKKSDERYQETIQKIDNTYKTMLEILKQDSEYKQLLAGYLAEIKTELKHIKCRAEVPNDRKT